ncbi:immunoglobulin-like domain-containing protein, partial [Enterococcus sp. C76]|uniref:immunoglobulin-like domain-containing protein n=1 Tax=Enterococcus sp. C76 TaxID=3231334 RepID=UPI0034A020C8
MKFKKTLGTLLISVSILGTITPTNSIFAEEDCQAPTVQQNQQVVTIPDVNLKKALNNVLGQEENHEITADQLATIEKLDLVNLGLKSIEGLQYCKNLKELWLGSANPSYHLEDDSNPNQVTDLTPLKGLTKLTKLAAHGLPVTDFSPLKNLPLSSLYSLVGGFVRPPLTLHANNTFSCKLPEYIGIDGQVIDFSGAIESCKDSLDGGIYDKATQTITWPCETFYKGYYPSFNYSNNGFVSKTANCCLAFTFRPQTELILVDKALDLTFALFENKQPASGKLAADITQETITKAREEIEKLDDNYNQWACNLRKCQSKADLLEWINKAQQLYDQQIPSKSLEITLDKYIIGATDTIIGTYNDMNAKFLRIEVNGEKKALIASKDLANGQIKYYVGKDLKASDDVQVVLFDQNYQEIGRQRVNLEEPIITKLT